MKRLIALLLVLVMCVGMFAACAPAVTVADAAEYLLGANFKYDFPFRIGIINTTLINDYTISYTFGNNLPEWDGRLGLNFSLPINNINFELELNQYAKRDISFAIFTLTSDLNADFPAKYARINCGFNKVPMMCYHELDVENSLKMCLRVLLNINTQNTQDEIKHIYLKGAKTLRQDI